VIRVICAATLGVCFGSVHVDAQDIAVAPRGGLFGAAAPSKSSNQLDVVAAVTQARDSEAPVELRSRIPQDGAQSGGYSSIMTASADYSRKRSTFNFDGNAVTSMRYYQRLDHVSMVGSTAAVTGMVNLPTRATLALTQEAAYSPSYLFRLFPTVGPVEMSAPAPGAADYQIDEARSYSLNSKVTFESGSPRHHRVGLRAERTTTDFSGVARRPNLNILTGSGKWAHGIGRTGAVSAEYEFRRGEFGYGSRATEQRLRIGADIAPALSRTRRATFRFSLAPSVIDIPDSTNAAVTGSLFRIEGEAGAQYPFLRSWSAGGSYRRNVEYIAVLRAPVFQNATRLELSGLVSSRLDLSASAGTSVGQSALNRDGQQFDTYTGTVETRYSVSRSFAFYVEYLYYYYNLHGQSELAPDLPNRFEQHGIRAGVMLWARPIGR